MLDRGSPLLDSQNTLILPWTVNHLARGSMKNAANCASYCELQDTWTSTFRTHIAVLGYCSWTIPGWGSFLFPRLPGSHTRPAVSSARYNPECDERRRRMRNVAGLKLEVRISTEIRPLKIDKNRVRERDEQSSSSAQNTGRRFLVEQFKHWFSGRLAVRVERVDNTQAVCLRDTQKTWHNITQTQSKMWDVTSSSFI